MFKYANYAYEIYKEKSFTKAAEKLFISQPSLSLTIKKLEDNLGVPIFDRSGREICLTDIGEKYISAIEEINIIEKNLKNEIDDLKKMLKKLSEKSPKDEVKISQKDSQYFLSNGNII